MLPTPLPHLPLLRPWKLFCEALETSGKQVLSQQKTFELQQSVLDSLGNLHGYYCISFHELFSDLKDLCSFV